MPKLNIIQNEWYIRKTGNIEDPVKKHHLSSKYQYHPSLTNIKDIMKSKKYFLFQFAACFNRQSEKYN